MCLEMHCLLHFSESSFTNGFFLYDTAATKKNDACHRVILSEYLYKKKPICLAECLREWKNKKC